MIFWKRNSFVRWLFLYLIFANQAQAQFFAEMSYKLWYEACPKTEEPTPFQQVDNRWSVLCSNPRSEKARADLTRRNMGEISDDAMLASLAAEKSKALDCTISQVAHLNSNPEDLKKFIEDYKQKLMMLAQEKRLIKELRDKKGKTESDLEVYDQAIERAKLMAQSLPFSDLKAFQKVIRYSFVQFEAYSEDRLQEILPAQLNNLLQAAVVDASGELRKNKAILEKGVNTFGESLDSEERESLMQNADLVEAYRQKHQSQLQEMNPSFCRLDAKYGRGAKARDQTILAASWLALPASGLTKVGAVGLTSSVTGAAALGQISIRTAGVLRVLARAGATAGGLSQIHKACIADYTTVSTVHKTGSDAETCESNMIKSQDSENCVLSAALSALGAYKVGTEVKGAYQVFRDKQKADAIQKAHLIGRGEQGIDGTAAKVGNYTFKQKYRKARILQKAGISKDERRRLFQNGVVGDSKEIDDLIEIEDQIADLEMNAWKFKDSQKEILDGLKALRADLDAALDSSPAEMAEKVRQLQEKMKKLTSANKSPLTVLPKLDDILENPGALRKAEVIELNQGGARNWKMKFENG